MDGALCLLALPIWFVGVGLVIVFKKDWAWCLVELMLGHLRPQRTPEWENGTTINGVMLIVVGLGFMLYIIATFPRIRPGG